jgi:uncharacterized protein (TIGR03083 family)
MMDLIAAERRALVDALDGFTPDQWQGPSMCAGWTPVHVLAHMTMPFRISELDFMAGLERFGGDFTTFSDGIAERDSKLPPAELVAVLRANADTEWIPPGGVLASALSHDVIHGLDMTWLLDIRYAIDDRALVSVLESITSPGDQTLFGVPIDGSRFTATDVDWSHGTGAEVSGSARDLVMLLSGRTVPGERFDGEVASLAKTGPGQ